MNERARCNHLRFRIIITSKFRIDIRHIILGELHEYPTISIPESKKILHPRIDNLKTSQ